MALLAAASSTLPFLMVPGLSGTRQSPSCSRGSRSASVSESSSPLEARSPSCSREGSTGRSPSVSESSSPPEARSPSCSRGGSTGRSSSVSVSSSPLDSWSSCSTLSCSLAGSSSSSSPLMAASGSRSSSSSPAPSSSALESPLVLLMIVNSTPLKRFRNRLLSSIARVGLVMLIYSKGESREKDTKRRADNVRG